MPASPPGHHGEEAIGKTTLAGYDRTEGQMLLILGRGSVISPERLVVVADDTLLIPDEKPPPASIADLCRSTGADVDTK